MNVFVSRRVQWLSQGRTACAFTTRAGLLRDQQGSLHSHGLHAHRCSKGNGQKSVNWKGLYPDLNCRKPRAYNSQAHEQFNAWLLSAPCVFGTLYGLLSLWQVPSSTAPWYTHGSLLQAPQTCRQHLNSYMCENGS